MPKGGKRVRPLTANSDIRVAGPINNAQHFAQSLSAKELTPAPPRNTPRGHSLAAKSTGQSADSQSHPVNFTPEYDSFVFAGGASSLRSEEKLRKVVSSASSAGFSIEGTPLNLSSERAQTAPLSSVKKSIKPEYRPIKNAKDLSKLLIAQNPSLAPSEVHDGDATNQKNIDFLFNELRAASAKAGLKRYTHNSELLYLFPLSERVIRPILENTEYNGKSMFGGTQKISNIVAALMAIKVARGLHETPPAPLSRSATPFVDSINNSVHLAGRKDPLPNQNGRFPTPDVARILHFEADSKYEEGSEYEEDLGEEDKNEKVFDKSSRSSSSTLVASPLSSSPLKALYSKDDAFLKEFSDASEKIKILKDEAISLLAKAAEDLTRGEEINFRATDFIYKGVNLTQKDKSSIIAPSDEAFLKKVTADQAERLKRAEWLLANAKEIGPLLTELREKFSASEETPEGLNEIYDYIRNRLPEDHTDLLAERDEDEDKNKDDIIEAIDVLLLSNLQLIYEALPGELKAKDDELNLEILISKITDLVDLANQETQKERTEIADKLGFNNYDEETNGAANKDITRDQLLELLEKEARKKRSDFIAGKLAPALNMKGSSSWKAIREKIEALLNENTELSKSLEDLKSDNELALESAVETMGEERRDLLNEIYAAVFGELVEGGDISAEDLVKKLLELKEKLDSSPDSADENSTHEEQLKAITKQKSELVTLQAQVASNIEATKLAKANAQKELTDIANRLEMNGYSDEQTGVNDAVTARKVSDAVDSIIEEIKSLRPVLDELAGEINPTLKRKTFADEDLEQEAEDGTFTEDDKSFKSRILEFLNLRAQQHESLEMAGEDFNAGVKKTEEFSTQTDGLLGQFSMQPAGPDYSKILESICTEIGNLKDALENLNLVAEEGWSKASKKMVDEEERKQKEKEKRRGEKGLLKETEKEVEEKRREEEGKKNTERDRLLDDFRKELTELKSKMEQEKKEAADAVKAEKEKTEKATEAARIAKEKEEKEKAAQDKRDAKAAKEKAVEDAKGPLQKFYDALEVQINSNPGKTILTPFGVSLKDLKEMGIDRNSLPGSIIPTAADKKNR